MPENLLDQVPEKAGVGFIDKDGVVRIDRWVLQVRGDDLVLTYRFVPLTTKFSYQFSASLERLNQQWKITSIGLERLTMRR